MATPRTVRAKKRPEPRLSSTRLHNVLPRYKAIAAELIAEIAADRFQVGSTLPGEHELSQRFKVSRFTVREALRELRDLGIVRSRQGAGTMVLSRYKGDPYVNSMRSLTEILQHPLHTRFVPGERLRVRLDEELSRLVGARPGDQFVKLSGLRSEPGKAPICWSDFYICPDVAQDFYDLLEQHDPQPRIIEESLPRPISGVRIELFAAAATGERAKALGIAQGSPAMTVIRRYIGPDLRVMVSSVSLYPEGRFTYAIAVDRSQTADANSGSDEDTG